MNSELFLSTHDLNLHGGQLVSGKLSWYHPSQHKIERTFKETRKSNPVSKDRKSIRGPNCLPCRCHFSWHEPPRTRGMVVALPPVSPTRNHKLTFHLLSLNSRFSVFWLVKNRLHPYLNEFRNFVVFCLIEHLVLLDNLYKYMSFLLPLPTKL